MPDVSRGFTSRATLNDLEVQTRCVVRAIKDTHEFLYEHGAFTLPPYSSLDFFDSNEGENTDTLLSVQFLTGIRDDHHVFLLHSVSTMPQLREWLRDVSKDQNVDGWLTQMQIDTTTNTDFDYARIIPGIHRELVLQSHSKVMFRWCIQGREWGFDCATRDRPYLQLLKPGSQRRDSRLGTTVAFFLLSTP